MKLTRREFGFASAALTAGTLAPLSVLGASAPAASVAIDPMSLVDAELRGPLQFMLKQYPPMEWSEKVLPSMRKMSERFWQKPLDEPAIVERMIPGPEGAPQVRIFVVGASESAAPRPLVLHIHGGGYVSGAAAQRLQVLQQLASTLDCVVVTVDYRLAPETKFPGSLEDNFAALRWVHANANELGIDRTRIALLGESAGGGHAAALAIAARDRGEIPIAMQVLIYPMLDDRTGSTRPVPSHIGAYVWTADANRFGWKSLLGVAAGSDAVPRGSVPARVENLSGLPPTWIGVGSIDLFVQENVAFAQRLIEAGVPTELYVAAGGFHGFDLIVPGAAISKQFTASWTDSLGRRFGSKPKV